MRDAVDAAALVADAAASGAVTDETIRRVFRAAPLDFPVIITNDLPFLAHRFGATGITIARRVYLMHNVVAAPGEEMIVLLRHEAEHVRQQRESRLFYARYVASWLRHFARIITTNRLHDVRGLRARLAVAWRLAYRLIPAEVEAYAAGERARTILRGQGVAVDTK